MEMTNLEIVQKIADAYTPSLDSQWGVVFREESTFGIHACLKDMGETILLVFRGSITPEDWLDDAISETTVTKNRYPQLGEIPLGFGRGMVRFMGLVGPYLKMPLIVAGHSLGAARAAIFTGMAVSSGLQVNKLVMCGCPRPGKLDLKNELKDIQKINFRNGNDFICNLPTDPPFEQMENFTLVRGGQDLFPGLFMYHHIQFYVRGVQLWEEANG